MLATSAGYKDVIVPKRQTYQALGNAGSKGSLPPLQIPTRTDVLSPTPHLLYSPTPRRRKDLLGMTQSIIYGGNQKLSKLNEEEVSDSGVSPSIIYANIGNPLRSSYNVTVG